MDSKGAVSSRYLPKRGSLLNGFVQPPPQTNRQTDVTLRMILLVLREIRLFAASPAEGASEKRQTGSKTMRAPLVVKYETLAI